MQAKNNSYFFELLLKIFTTASQFNPIHFVILIQLNSDDSYDLKCNFNNIFPAQKYNFTVAQQQESIKKKSESLRVDLCGSDFITKRVSGGCCLQRRDAA